MKPGRNDQCPCGSGKKFKKCCQEKFEAVPLSKEPTIAEINQVVALFNAGQHDAMEKKAQLLVTQYPDSGLVWKMLGIFLLVLGKEGIPSLQKSVELSPDDAEAHFNLGCAMIKIDLDQAISSLHLALQINPEYADAHLNLGVCFATSGRQDEAEASYRRGLELNPDNAGSYSNLLFSRTHNVNVNAKTLFAEHCRFGEYFEAPLRKKWLKHRNSRDTKRCLQVGIVSGDLCHHAVATFIEPVLMHLMHSPQLSLHAYFNHATEDSVTQRLKGYFFHWHAITGLTDADLAEKIRADGIDILIDLSGHTGHNRLLTFARKPSPVQASWLGYPGTTGLTSIDYYLADRFAYPNGKFDDQFTEKIVLLPATAPFLPSEHAPSVNTLPALKNNFVTFGSFNRINKITRPVISLWSKLLRSLPNSRIVLGGMPETGKYDTLIEWFMLEGIAREQLSFYQRGSLNSYLILHHQVDICLDTFPYNGGTTTLHALWMGVPTLTLAGSTTAGRSGACILGHVELEKFVAHDADEFLQKGLFWADNLPELSNIRAGLREHFAKSAIGQPALVAASLEQALRTMWQRWCAGLPPEPFEVTVQ